MAQAEPDSDRNVVLLALAAVVALIVLVALTLLVVTLLGAFVVEPGSTGGLLVPQSG